MTYIDDGQLLATAGAYKVYARLDHSPTLPWGDCYAPQYMMPWSWKQADDIALNMDRDLQAWLYSIVMHFRNYLHDSELALETLERYARIFHGVNARVFNTAGYSQGDYADIIVWPTADWLETVGLDNSYIPTEIDVADLSSYLWGDTYLLEVMERVEWRRNGSDEVKIELESIDFIGGYYCNQGQDTAYMYDAALELLREYTDDEARTLADDELNQNETR